MVVHQMHKGSRTLMQFRSLVIVILVSKIAKFAKKIM